MATYYVSTTGNDNGNGSAGSPWRTISYALDSGLQPGDEVVVKPGTYTEQLNIRDGGSAIGGDVTIRSEEPGAALIRPPSWAWNAVNVYSNYVTVDGFDVQSTGGGDGIEANDVHHISILNNIAHDNGESGIQFNWSEFITVDGNVTYGNAWGGWFSGISIYQSRNITGDTTTPGYRTVVTNNISYDNVTQGGAHTDGNGIIIDDFRSTQISGYQNYTYPTLVENNLLHNNGGKGIHVYLSDYVTVRNNTAYHNNQDLQNNGTWRGELSNQDSRNTTWINNIAVADPSVNPNNVAIGFYGNNGNNVWQNNLTYNGTPGDASMTLQGGNNSAPTTANGNLLGVNPGFVSAPSDFSLKSGSAAVDGGSPAYGLASTDLDGNTRAVGAVDIGAYEYGSGGTTPPTGPTNTNPNARNDSGFSTDVDTQVTITGASLLANDTDADGDALSITGVGSAVNGSVRLTNQGNVVFTPTSGASGNAQFQYAITDNNGGADTATVSLDIDGSGTTPPTGSTNTNPNARNDSGFSTDVDTQVTITGASLLANDTDADGDALTITGVGSAVNGSVRLTNQGNVVFTPMSGASGNAQFQYAITDNNGGADTATVSLDIDTLNAVDTFSFFGSGVTPALVTDPDQSAVELGMKFLVEVDGEIEALRFFKGPDNDGAHSARLWTDTGQLITSVDFTSETSQGWQQVDLSQPIQVDADEVYIVSYHAPNGGYSVTENYFTAPMDIGPLTALADGGVYAYGVAGSFPNSTYNASNYFVDVVFDPDVGGTGTGGGTGGTGGGTGGTGGGTGGTGGGTGGTGGTGGGTGSLNDPIGEAGTITFSQASSSQWRTITFAEELDNPSVAMGGLTSNGSHASTLRVRNVTDSGFEFQLDEWDYLDGQHSSETASWVAIEQGTHTLSNGQVVEAGSTTASGSARTVDIGNGVFNAAPVVLAQVTSTNEASAVTDRIAKVTSNGFTVELDREEDQGSQSHGTETVDWIAFQSGGTADTALVAGATGNSVTHKASSADFAGAFASGNYAFVADMQTRNGSDPANVRLASQSDTLANVYIHEEQSRDSEVTHLAETVGYLGVEVGLIYTDLALM